MGNMELSLFELVIVRIFEVAVIGFLIWLVVKSIRRRGTGKTVTVRARVLSKAIQDYVTQPAYISGNQVDLGVTEKGKVYNVVFEPVKEGKKCLEFEVSEDAYSLLEEGAEDDLTYKGEKFLRFGRVTDSGQTQGGEFVTMNEEMR